jgi:hypothetical protein
MINPFSATRIRLHQRMLMPLPETVAHQTELGFSKSDHPRELVSPRMKL